MIYRNRIMTALSLLAVTVPACTDTEHPRKQPDAIVPAFTAPVVILKLSDNTEHHFGIKSCDVYRSVKTKTATSEWTLLFKPAPYALPQTCVRERLAFDGKYLQIEIGTQGFGAGGCCTNYAAYRSRDGKNWEIRPATSITQWQKLDSER